MALKVLQMDYPFSGPWGSEMAEEYSHLARRIADVTRPYLQSVDGESRRREKRVGFICLRMKLHWILTWQGKSSG